MLNIAIKPLSVNDAWQGRRFKTAAYKRYERDVLMLLPPCLTIPAGRLSVGIEFGLSNTACDIDNPVKLFLDILQKKYSFNDNRIYQLNLLKTAVKKNREFIRFNIKAVDHAFNHPLV